MRSHHSTKASDQTAKAGVSRHTSIQCTLLKCGLWNLDIKNAAFITSDFTEFIYMDSVGRSSGSISAVF